MRKQTNTLSPSPSPKCFQSPSPRTSEKSADSDVRKALPGPGYGRKIAQNSGGMENVSVSLCQTFKLTKYKLVIWKNKHLCTCDWSSSSWLYSDLGHSSGLGYKVCLKALSGSYSNDTPAVGFHFACSLANPFLAYAFTLNS
jgi:hypothetical protein